MENDIWNRPGGLAGIWGSLVREWLDELLPEDAAERCNGRVSGAGPNCADLLALPLSGQGSPGKYAPPAPGPNP